MRRVRLSVTWVSAVLVFVLVVPVAAASTICQTSLPANISGGLLQAEMLALLERSETFRQQCRRIAAAPYVRVRFDLGPRVIAGGRAQTIINRYEAGAIVAFVTIRFAEDYAELISHELEHVIEQIEGVRLHVDVSVQRVFLSPTGAYETPRATAVGVRVRQEFGALAVEPVQHDGRKPPAQRGPFD